MATEREQKLVDIIFECMLVSHDKEFRTHFEAMSREEIAEWTAKQLKGCGFPTVPVGMSWGSLHLAEKLGTP